MNLTVYLCDNNWQCATKVHVAENFEEAKKWILDFISTGNLYIEEDSTPELKFYRVKNKTIEEVMD